MNKNTRICPSCNKPLFYKTLKLLKTAIRKNTICKSCNNKENGIGRIMSDKTKNKLSKITTGIKRSFTTKQKHKINYLMGKGFYTINHLQGADHPRFGKHCTLTHKLKLSKLKKGKPLSQQHKNNISKSQLLKHKKHSEETKRKQRLAKIKYIKNKNGSIAPRYNQAACQYFNKLEKENNWNGFYATKNKEFLIKHLGYFVDYYEPTLNLVIEYDEKLHYNIDGTLKQKDIQRMTNIKNHLKCKFFRYNENTKQLVEFS